MRADGAICRKVPMRGKAVYVTISAHGYGHVAQTAPVLNELCRRRPDLRLVIESETPRDYLARRVKQPFEHVCIASDFGMVMHDALRVDIDASHARYLAMHAKRDQYVAAARERLGRARPALLVSNVPYFPLVAAHHLGVPAVALCSLNWAAIYGGVAGGRPGAEAICAYMRGAYQSSSAFLVPRPGMPMADFENVRHIGPIAETGQARRSDLCDRLGRKDCDRLVLVSMGGIGMQLQLERWPRIEGVRWIVAGNESLARSDMVSVADIQMPYLDVLASCDALVTKLGYGAFVEAACAGIPVAYVARADWPETPFLTSWLEQNARATELPYDALCDARLERALHALWSLPPKPAIVPTGIADAATVIEDAIDHA